jgi:predicted PurR-regulated permease PerM
MSEQNRMWLFTVVIVSAVVLAGFVMQPFLAAIMWASVLTVLTWPWFKRLRAKLIARGGRWKKLAGNLASLVVCTYTVLLLLLPFLLVGAGLYWQSLDATSATKSNGIADILKTLDGQIVPLAKRFGNDFSLTKYWEENRDTILAAARQPAIALAKNVGVTLYTLSAALLTQFFMLRDGEKLAAPALDLLPFSRERNADLLRRLYDTIWAVFYGTVLVAIIQGALMGITYAALGIPNAMVLGVITMLLAIIPLLGAPILYIPIILLLLAQGDIKTALILFGVGGGFVSQIDNVLRPFFIGGRTNLHPIGVFFSILGGLLFFGPIGVMMGPLLLSFLLVAVEALRNVPVEPLNATADAGVASAE